MQKSIFFLFFLLISPFYSPAQRIENTTVPIHEMIRQISGDSLKSYIQALVSFKTRHTLSNQTAANQGIGAARKWVLQKFQEAAVQSDGRMTAKIDFWQQPADHRRVNRPIRMGNVMGILKGTDPHDHRIFIVSAHLDSRNTDITFGGSLLEPTMTAAA